MEKFQINDLVVNFRSALVALVPSFESARIAWKDESAQYDDFDEISECLFRNLVYRTIAYGLDDYSLLDTDVYGFDPQSPSDGSFIVAVVEGETVGRFLKFATDQDPFDRAILLPSIEAASESVSDRLSVGVDEVQFAFHYANANGASRLIHSADVEL